MCLGGPTGSFLNRRGELHSRWAGYKKVLEGGLERIASTPPNFVEVVVREKFLILERTTSTPLNFVEGVVRERF